MNLKTIAYIKLVLAIIMWSGVYHAAKYLVREADIASVAFVRFLLASIVLIPLYYRSHHGVSTEKSKRYWGLLFLIGFIGIFVYTLLFFGAEKFISADEIAILFAFTPCITAFLSVVILKQKVSVLGYIGIAVALVGTIGVLGISNPTCGQFFCASLFSQLSVGQILAILASCSMAFYSILTKKATLMHIDSISITTFSILFGTVLLFINFLLFGGNAILLLHKSFSFWIAMSYTSVLATVIGYKWYSDAIREISVDKVSVFLNGIPFCTILIGLVINGRGVSLAKLVSGIIIVLGVFITNYAAKSSVHVVQKRS